jgi:hypothetical protein
VPILEDVATQVLSSVILTAGRKITETLTGMYGRSHGARQDVQLFDTYKLTDEIRPRLAAEYPQSATSSLYGAGFQAVLHELIAVRLTGAPESDVRQLSESFHETADRLFHPSDVDKLFDFFDKEIKHLVAELRKKDEGLLRQVQQQAYLSRIVFAIQRQGSGFSGNHSPLSARLNFLEHYRRHLREQHGELRPPDFERRRKVPIEKLYVPQVMTQEMGRAGNSTGRIGIHELDWRIDRTVLLGHPGVGKTTATQALLYLHAIQPDRPIPFLVVLREFAADNGPSVSVLTHIENKLETFYQCKAPPGVIERCLLNGSSLVIFDGLDELVDTTRRANISDIIERFCSEYPLTKVLVTSRTIGYDEGRLDDRQFTCYHLQQFDDEAVRTYVQNWFASDKDSGQVDPETFLAESASVADLRCNPLMLGLMCILYRGEGSIPRNRAEIYEKCTRLLFEKWDSARKIHVDLRARSLVEQSLRHLAYWLLASGDGQTVVTERELIHETGQYFLRCGYENFSEAEEAAAEFVSFCRGRMWVLSEVGITGNGESLYRFTHRTFLEYYAAYYLASVNDSPEQLTQGLEPKIVRAEWDTIAQLAVQIKARNAEQGGERIFRSLLTEAARQDLQRCGNILSFLGRCTTFIEPAATSVRMLTRLCFNILASDPNNRARVTPLGWLMLSAAPEIRGTINDELYLRTSELVESSDPGIEMLGLRIAANRNILPRAVGETRSDWGWDGRFEGKIFQAAQGADDLAAWVCSYSRYSYELLRRRQDLPSFLFRQHPAHILGLSWEAPAVWLLRGFISGDSRVLPAFDALGERLRGGPFEKVTRPPSFAEFSSYSDGDANDKFIQVMAIPEHSIHNDLRFGTAEKYAAAAYLLAISVEDWKPLPPSTLGPLASTLGPLSPFFPYALCRYQALRTESNYWRTLAPLPVSSHWNELFLRWVRREINFVS